MKSLNFEGDFWLLPGDANEEAGLLLWPQGRCSIKEKPIEFREIYCNDLNCICEEVRLIAIDHALANHTIANIRLKLAMNEPGNRTYKITWSGSFEPAEVRLAFTQALETEPSYFEHLRSMHATLRRAMKHQASLAPQD